MSSWTRLKLCPSSTAAAPGSALRYSPAIDAYASNPSNGRMRLPAGAPERPKEAGGYLPVHDLPPDRNEEAIKPAELAKIQSELTAARDRQATASTPTKPAKK